ncbi:MAG: ribonuclease HI family protein [Candidatus Pacebacteria bacterium]|nr:ribonuclease HI family protein [Candidatus Paceibacterota bacterium]
MDKKRVNYSVYCDGGARGNPGPAGVGFVVYDYSGHVLAKGARFIGRATNNVAEYRAVVEALKWFKTNRIGELSEIRFHLDSMLVVNQLNGLYKIKNSGLRELIITVRQLENEIEGAVFYQHVPREKNKEADALVNQIIKKNLTALV